MSTKQLPAFSERIRKLREKAGLTQQQLANDAGLSMSLVTQDGAGAQDRPR